MTKESGHKKHRPYRAHHKGAAISVSKLLVEYDGTPIVDNVSFEIPAGLITAIIGPNGSGKTTLLKSLLELIDQKEGEVKFFGKELKHVREHIGYVPQRFIFDVQFPITVEEFLLLALHEHTPHEHIHEKLEEVGLDEKVGRQILGQLSGGQLQRVLIARAVLNNPDLLLLDEPYAGIDVVGESTFYEILKHLKELHHTTIVMVSHEVDILSTFVDEVLCFNRKLVCQGPPLDMFKGDTMARLFGKEAAFYKHVINEKPAKKKKGKKKRKT